MLSLKLSTGSLSEVKIYVTLFGKTGLNENSVVMHLKCIDNGSQRICNVIQSIVKTLTMFNKIMFKNG